MIKIKSCFYCKHIKSKDWFNPIFYCNLDKEELTYEIVNFYYCEKFEESK